jgi:hypothetical protein
VNSRRATPLQAYSRTDFNQQHPFAGDPHRLSSLSRRVVPASLSEDDPPLALLDDGSEQALPPFNVEGDGTIGSLWRGQEVPRSAGGILAVFRPVGKSTPEHHRQCQQQNGRAVTNAPKWTWGGRHGGILSIWPRRGYVTLRVMSQSRRTARSEPFA